ncbi:transglutaminase domain-containing protein [Flammeovirga aprica]|uniref:Transglutaminase-like domain-containing protein n=1 Tax=Flammeovirga aprica JL-4 TaxID=694437 RepID=A0A7X9P374_9BACT|nr:transglutaminase domain-containing protein [Flammeovirga aprica]NME68353.1 hypothetical protein [Flammeovirga aprica JL-4]
MKPNFLFLFFFLIVMNSNGIIASPSIDLYHYDFQKIDAEVRSKKIHNYRSVKAIAENVVNVYQHPHERVRAAWIWVTDNINYDVGIFNLPNYTAETQPHLVLLSRKTVCAGYSQLLKAILDITDPNICQVVTGFGKTSVRDVEKHAWNIVNLYGYSYLLDATWGAGFTYNKTISFTRGKTKIEKAFKKSYSEFWFLTPPSYFAVSHYTPTAWQQLLVTPISFALFKETPYVYPNYFINEISIDQQELDYDPVIIHDDIKVLAPINLKSEWLFFHPFFTQGAVLKPQRNQTSRVHFYSKNYYDKIKVNDVYVKPVISKRKVGYDYYIPCNFKKSEEVTLQDSWSFMVEVQ